MGKIIVVTGLSGAGKTQTLKNLEDLGYYCIDNLPVEIVDKFVSLIFSENINKTAIGIDIRQEKDFEVLKKELNNWKKKKQEYKILFLDASDNTIVKRYKETKRKHPLEGKLNLLDSIKLEREKTSWLRESADYLIKTDDYTNYDLKNKISSLVATQNEKTKMDIDIISFGYKNGIPSDIDLLYDVRFLKNPFYEDNLRNKTGLDKEVATYIEKDKNLNKFLKKLTDILTFTIPLYKNEGKSKIVIAFACTGGNHRSVYIADRIYKELNKLKSYNVMIEHRDMKKV